MEEARPNVGGEIVATNLLTTRLPPYEEFIHSIGQAEPAYTTPLSSPLKPLLEIMGSKDLKVEIGVTVDTVLFHVVDDFTDDCSLVKPGITKGSLTLRPASTRLRRTRMHARRDDDRIIRPDRANT